MSNLAEFKGLTEQAVLEFKTRPGDHRNILRPPSTAFASLDTPEKIEAIDWLWDRRETHCWPGYLTELVQGFKDPVAWHLLELGIREEDPSSNRVFIRPALRRLGLARVLERLLESWGTADDGRRAGILDALYWVQADGKPQSEEEAATAREVLDQIKRSVAEAFVMGGDVSMMRSAIAKISLWQERESNPSLLLLYKACYKVATSHSDEYVRHRADLMVPSDSNEPRLFHPKPPRE